MAIKYSSIALFNSFIHSGYFYSAFNSTTTRRSRHSTNTVSEFHAEAPQETANKGFAQGPYLEARAEFESTTLRTKGDESNNLLWCCMIL